MRLKQQSIIISVVSTIVLITATLLIINKVSLVKFQEIENQRVERNIRRTTAIIDDKLEQMNSKIADWAIWDDTYKFMSDSNQEFIESNLTPESFKNMGVEQLLLINKNGTLVNSLMVKSDAHIDNDFPQDLYQFFATGSALLKIKKDPGYNKGILSTKNGVVLYVARNIYKSDNTGVANGAIVFASYFDDDVLNSVKSLTQFEAKMYNWNDPKTTNDFQDIKDLYNNASQKSLTKVLDDQIISGYLIIEDVFGKPAVVVRTDIQRDIALQGKETMMNLIYLILGFEIITAILNYWLLTKVVLKKVLGIAKDIEVLEKSQSTEDRLSVGKANDEVDNLRSKINALLDSLKTSKSALQNKEQFINFVMDNLNIGIAINKISTGEAIYMNKAFQTIYGWTKNDLTSVDSFFEKVYPDPNYRKTIKDRVITDIQSKDKDRMHWRGLEITKSTGEKSIVDAANIPLLEQDLMVSTVIDITQTAKEEKKREEYAKELR